MNLRNLSLTVAALVAASAVAWFLQRPAAPASTDARVGQPLLAADTAGRVARLTLSDQGKTVELARRADGGWVVPSYHDFPADFSKLSRLISDLSEAKVQRLVTSRADRLSRLEFKDTAIKLTGADGQEIWNLTLGKSAEGGGRFVRFGTEEKGYQANLNAWLDPDAKNWADAALLNLKPDDIASVEFGFADGTTATATRTKKEEPWTAANTPAGKRVKVSTLTTVLSNLASLRFTDTTAPDDEKAVAARAHSRTLKLGTFDGKSYTVALGRTPEEKKSKAPAAPAASAPTDAAVPTTAPSSPATMPVQPASTSPAAPADGAAAPAPVQPEYETIPAGPVFVTVTASDEKAVVNELMRKRAFQISEWTFTSLPAAAADLWEDAPVPAPAAPATVPVSSTTPPIGGPAPAAPAAGSLPATPPEAPKP